MFPVIYSFFTCTVQAGYRSIRRKRSGNWNQSNRPIGSRGVVMVAANQVLLVGNDSGFRHTIAAQLRKLLDETPLVCTPDGLRQYVGPSTDGLILLVAASSADTDSVRSVLQELQLWNFPPRVVLLESAAANLGTALGPLEPRLADRRLWRDNPRELLGVLREHAGRSHAFHDPVTAAPRERLRWRVLNSVPSLATLLETLEIATLHDIPLLLTGEHGAGKSFLAKLIHDHSSRASHRFVSISCQSMPGQLIAGELFGYGKGALTSSEVGRPGKLALAGQGTLVLDEIDCLPIEHQANLLRVLETGEFEPIGSDETAICGARIMATSTQSLEACVDRGTFRQDLYYRLNVLVAPVPPLRERPHDIEPLVRLLVARFAVKFGKEILRIDPTTFEALRDYDWPGNVRQLEHVLQQAVLLSQGPELLVKNPGPISNHRCPSALSYRPAMGALEQSRLAAERLSILRALETNQYCRSRAAEALGISRVTLYKKMREFGLLSRPARPRPKTIAGA
jgi:DNA-binding NtrC family response regulator